MFLEKITEPSPSRNSRIFKVNPSPHAQKPTFPVFCPGYAIKL
jgi:hypothetical protein